MAFGRIKISPADRLFSLFIRQRDEWTCQRCKRQEHGGMQNSHYFGRTKKSVRWDEENCDTLCHGCHRFWEKEDREGYRDFKIQQLGQRRFDLLNMRANTLMTQKADEKLIAMYYRQELKKLGFTNI